VAYVNRCLVANRIKVTAFVSTFFDYHSRGGTRCGWSDPRQVLFLQCPIENWNFL